MATDRPNRFRRARNRVEVEPEIVADEMEAATKRLRDQAWKINATTRTPMIRDDELAPEQAPEQAPTASEAQER